jgi:hypothetical protein
MKISAHETLLVIDEIKGRNYITETDFFDKAMNERQIVAELTDTTVRVLKLDLPALKTTDVTEECAMAWIYDRDANCIELVEEDLPPFVRDSDAWAEWAMTIPAPKSEPDPDYLYEEKRDRMVFGAKM